jgi:transposase
MKLTALEAKLIAAARHHQPDETVPYVFEKRIMARLAATPPLDEWAIWSRALWRATAPCIALMLFLSLWSLLSAKGNNRFDNPSEAFETTVLAGINQIGESW